jgi:hypothetical protein
MVPFIIPVMGVGEPQEAQPPEVPLGILLDMPPAQLPPAQLEPDIMGAPSTGIMPDMGIPLEVCDP